VIQHTELQIIKLSFLKYYFSLYYLQQFTVFVNQIIKNYHYFKCLDGLLEVDNNQFNMGGSERVKRKQELNKNNLSKSCFALKYFDCDT